MKYGQTRRDREKKGVKNNILNYLFYFERTCLSVQDVCFYKSICTYNNGVKILLDTNNHFYRQSENICLPFYLTDYFHHTTEEEKEEKKERRLHVSLIKRDNKNIQANNQRTKA